MNTPTTRTYVSASRFAVRAMALALALVTVNAITALPGFAADRGVKVQTNDLDLKTEAGASKLYSRLKVAAAQSCGPNAWPMLEKRRAWEKCYERTLNAAVTSINEPTLLVIHQQQGKHSG